jgi:hypothetical protein
VGEYLTTATVTNYPDKIVGFVVQESLCNCGLSKSTVAVNCSHCHPRFASGVILSTTWLWTPVAANAFPIFVGFAVNATQD